MTLHALDKSHFDFVKQCYLHGGYDNEQAAYEAERVLELALAFNSESYFIGPSLDNPRWFVGAVYDDCGRAVLDAATIGVPGPSLLNDARDWLNYLFAELGVILLEAYVWTEDLSKEYLLRGLGFRKTGVVPKRVTIPGKGPQKALLMVMVEEYLPDMTDELFREKMAQLKVQLTEKEARQAKTESTE